MHPLRVVNVCSLVIKKIVHMTFKYEDLIKNVWTRIVYIIFRYENYFLHSTTPFDIIFDFFLR